MPDPVPVLSVVVPCFNEEAVIARMHARLREALERIEPDHEVVFVDDGSRDGTLAALRAIQAADAKVRFVALSRNFGHQVAVTAGLDHAAGKCIALIDADLQDPPEVIGEMLAKWREGYAVVYGQRVARHGEGVVKRLTASLFYRFLRRLSDVPIPLDTGDFRLIDRRVADALREMPERDRFLRGMISWVGFRQCAVRYERAPRAAGTTKYPLRKMITFALDGITSFSTKPLRIAIGLGFSGCGLAILGVVYALVLRLCTDIWVSGWTLLFISIMFMSGTQLVCIGIIGEYIGRIYSEVKRRPLYLATEVAGFDARSRPMPRPTSGNVPSLMEAPSDRGG